jgi:hypothetical protein
MENLEFLNYLYWIVFALAHLGCLVVAVILLLKVKGTPAILATVAFALLFIQDLGWVLRRWFLDGAIRRLMGFGPWAMNSCCCGLFQLAAFVCLIVAIWQAVSGKAEAV